MFQPLHRLVTVVLDEKNSDSKIVLPDNYEESLVTGVIRAVSPLIKKEKEEFGNLSPGSHVLLAQQPGQRGQIQPFPTLDDDGITVTLCNVHEILGIIIDDAVVT